MTYLRPHNRIKSLTRSHKDWAYKLYDINRLHQQGYKGQGVTVAIIDTGVNYQHPDFEGQRHSKLFVHSTIGENGLDYNGHGTWCVSKIGGNKYGFAPDVVKHSIQALDRYGVPRGQSVYDAFRLAIRLKPDYISASIGWPCDTDQSVMQDLVYEAQSYGITILAAAGNDGKFNDLDSPACLDGVISVGAFNSSLQRSVFSDWAYDIDMYAPGDGKAASHGNYIEHLRGTSMATPIAAASLALCHHILPEKINYTNIQPLLSCL